jgi:LmbE family N-acetylglucosaminyl deacetylase
MDTFNDEQRLEQRTVRGRSGSGRRIRATGTRPRDLVLTRYRGDLQREHRRVAELTWNTFRNRLVLESELPECDGDFGSPDLFVELDEELARRKTETSMRISGRQECAAARRHAEGFYCRKALQGRGR